MTTNFSPPTDYLHHDAPTLVRPRPTFAPQAPTPTWKTGWVVSGLAAALAVAALGTVGGFAFAMTSESHPAVTPVTMSTVHSPAPVLLAPAVTPPPPAAPEPVRIAGTSRSTSTTRVVVIPAPATPSEAVVPAASPVATPPLPPKPVMSPAPPIGIGTCDLVACEPTPPKPPTNCGIVVCHQVPKAPPNPLPSCGDFVACETIPAETTK